MSYILNPYYFFMNSCQGSALILSLFPEVSNNHLSHAALELDEKIQGRSSWAGVSGEAAIGLCTLRKDLMDY